MEASYALETGMVRTARFIAPQEMTLGVTIVVIHTRDRGFAIQTGMERIAAQTVLLKTLIGLVITTAVQLTAVNSVIATGTERVALSSALLTTTLTGITRVTKLTAAKFVWKIGLELSARRIAEQWTTPKGTIIVGSEMGLKYVTVTGMAQTVQCTVRREMTQRDIICVIIVMVAKYAT